MTAALAGACRTGTNCARHLRFGRSGQQTRKLRQQQGDPLKVVASAGFARPSRTSSPPFVDLRSEESADDSQSVGARQVPEEELRRRSAIRELMLECAKMSAEADFFAQLPDKQQNLLVERFEHLAFDPAEVVVEPGSASQFLLVLEGEAAVFAPGAPPGASPAATLAEGAAFGGRGLLRGAAAEERVVATSRLRVHRLTHASCLEALGAPLGDVVAGREIRRALGNILLFKNLTEQQVESLVQQLETRRFAAGEVIVRDGEEASHFFLIQSGSVRVSKAGRWLRTLGEWDYFGERGLLLQERRSATCEAEEPCVCLQLDKAVFHSVVGAFREELESRMQLQDLSISMADLRVKAVVGRGSFGIVKLVSHREDSERCYALKCVSKAAVVQQGQQKSIATEREINAQCFHPCIVQFVRTFQDAKNVYFLTEFLGGGELFYAIREIGRLTKRQVQFYAGSLVLAVEYLHARGIMYRDLKPENVLLDARGNAKIVDFGCCKKAQRTNSLVGTPEYMAPEVIALMGYTCAVDWWALGVTMHELVVGPLPFGGDTQDQLQLFREIREAPLRFPSYIVDSSAVSVITRLLERNPERRLGASHLGATEIKEHAYFALFDWEGLATRTLQPPWKPNLEQIQARWEVCSGEPAFDSEGALLAGKAEPGMEWAADF